MTKKIAVVGATGRMGKLALDLIEASQDLSVFAALDSKSELSAAIGADAIFDVTRLDVSQTVVAFAQENSIPVVVGTSGWSKDKLASLETNGSAVVVIPNFSVGSMLATRFAAEAAKFFGSIEIVEAHHAGKVDSPSGTAVRTAELIAQSRDNTPLVPGVGQEARGEVVAGVPIHSLRLEGVSAKQSVLLGGTAELLTISHETTSVAAYSAGILASLRFALTTQGVHVGLESVLG
ncbi:MAG: 4-hydroxy-tetrahydrodipicolinate reductase [Rhodoluna sp.]|nr:4-hydroxy-tetrahydrodipicolinate reductase [Rhodoluna sp.]